MSTETVDPTVSSAPAATPEPTPVAGDLAPWQEAYIQFLQEDNRRSREAARETESGYASIEEYYSICDVNGDQVPELILCYWEFGRYYVNLYAFQEIAPSLVGTFCIGRNGPFLYVCPQESSLLADLILYGPDGTSHTWRKFTWKEDSLVEEELLDELIPWEEGELEPVPGHAPTEAADLVPDAQPLELTALYPSLEPWQEAYRDILLCPEKYEEFYALSDEDIGWLREVGVGQSIYLFSLYDLDGNDIPELLLGYGKGYGIPRLLLNILRWNEETGTVEDMDGPRTYGLMDTLRFFENGYFSTMNGVSNLYTIYWKLEDTPGHYWSGFERPWMAGEEPKPEKIVYEDSQTGEWLSRDEFRALTGTWTATVESFQELTDENIQKAFLPTAREEEP